MERPANSEGVEGGSSAAHLPEAHLPSGPLPAGWNRSAHDLWQSGQAQAAIDAVLAGLRGLATREAQGEPVSAAMVTGLQQVAYYIYLTHDPLGAARFLQMARQREPDHPEVLRNLGVCLSRGGKREESIEVMRHLSVLRPDDAVCFDSLCSSLADLGRFEEARAAGSRALALKTRKTPAVTVVGWPGVPRETPAAWLRRQQGRSQQVISFSLWGHHPRYLRGAIDNVVAAREIYPAWVTRFHVDETVPAELRSELRALGAQVVLEPAGQPIRQRLAWRFAVAADPTVARFLVRDVDSRVSERERSAVEAWMASDRWFHVMRDWWTHTDPILAGLWGGVAGVLPNLQALLHAYRAPAMETPNIDQWFLRDAVWPLIQEHTLVHDRFFSGPGFQRWPQPDPVAGPGSEPVSRQVSFHVGQNTFAVEPEQQALRLSAWIARMDCL